MEQFIAENREALMSIAGYLLFQYLAPAKIAKIFNIVRLFNTISETKGGVSPDKDK